MIENEQKMEKAIRQGKQLPGMSFQQRVWALTANIPRGRVAMYGDLARKLHSAPRAVGRALHCNPYAPQVPCHRVVGSDGRLVGYAGGLPAKQKMLESEGVSLEGLKVDLSKHRMA
jgi:methylated-DNA-[protein]-cysteine S-methyltransferase